MNQIAHQSRVRAIDAVKCIAMIGVLLLHTQWAGSHPVPILLYEISLVSMPLFFMATGYILLSRGPVSASYSARKIYLILRILLLVSLPFWIWASIQGGEWKIVFLIVSGGMSLMCKGWNPLLWFFGVLIVIYLLLPLLSKATTRTRRTIMFTSLGVCLFMYLCNISGHMFEHRILQTLRVWYWLLYLLLGGELAQLPRKWVQKVPFWSVGLCMCAFLVSIHILTTDINTEGEYSYGNPLLILTVAGIMCLAIKHEARIPAFATMGTSLLLGTYVLQHYFLIFAGRGSLGMDEGMWPVVYFFAIGTAVMLTAAIFEYTPGLRSLITLDERRTELPWLRERITSMRRLAIHLP